MKSSLKGIKYEHEKYQKLRFYQCFLKTSTAKESYFQLREENIFFISEKGKMHIHISLNFLI